MEVRDDGETNPRIVIPPEEVMEWLRAKADEAGYSDRESCAVQTTFMDGHRLECPKLVLMVSNIKNSRSTAKVVPPWWARGSE